MTYLNRYDEGLATPSPGLTTAKGDVLLDALMGERRFEDAPVRPCRGRLMRPEPLGMEGRPSSIAANHGTAGGARRVHWAGTWIR